MATCETEPHASDPVPSPPITPSEAWSLSASLCTPEHIGQVVAWGSLHGPDPIAGAEDLARANLRSLAARHHLDMIPDWESRVAQKFGGYKGEAEYIRLCIVWALQPCRLSTASIANMCACLAYQSRDFAGWENSTAKLFLDRITAAAIEAARPDSKAVEWLYEG